jgi:hypothetical protein
MQLQDRVNKKTIQSFNCSTRTVINALSIFLAQFLSREKNVMQ